MKGPFAGPWPGPRPYDEQEWPVFRGRDREIEQVMNRLASQRLTILSGPSGSGKTSLLRAGVIPKLRQRRYRDKVDAPPVLVFRDWGPIDRSFSAFIISETERSLAQLAWWKTEGELAGEDYSVLRKALRKHGKGEDLVEFFHGLVTSKTSKINGLIVVFDQMEEILRVGRSIAREATRLLGDLCQSGISVKLLVSLREEQLTDLRQLERIVGGLMGQTVFLPRMGTIAAKEAVKEGAERAGLQFAKDETVIDDIMRILHGNRGFAGEMADEDCDLLALQALLYDLYCEELADKANTAEDWEFRSKDLESYLAKVFPVGSLSSSYDEGAGAVALKRWIERALQLRQWSIEPW